MSSELRDVGDRSSLATRYSLLPTAYFFLKSPAVTTESRFGSMCFRSAALTASGVSSLIFCSSSAWNSHGPADVEVLRDQDRASVESSARMICCCWR